MGIELTGVREAGKSVKKDTKDRPFFWYLREKAERYRVFDVTLRVHDAAAPSTCGAPRHGRGVGG